MMSRPLKFRAWDKATSRFLFPWPEGFHLFGEMTCFDLITQQLKPTSPDQPSLLRLNDVEIQQFTGLFDAQKQELYEGDLIRISKKPHHACLGGWRKEAIPTPALPFVAEVQYYGDGFYWTVPRSGFHYELGSLWPLGTDENVRFLWNTNGYQWLACDIVGNRYEQPELLS